MNCECENPKVVQGTHTDKPCYCGNCGIDL